MIKQILALGAALELLEQARELDERRRGYSQARAYADALGKPLLVVGTPKFVFNHPCGDVTIDNDPPKSRWCKTEMADVRAIPYPAHYFGAAFISHVLEHLPTVADARAALEELHRVADNIVVVSPHKNSITAWLHPGHHLWVSQHGDELMIKQRGKPDTSSASCIAKITAIP